METWSITGNTCCQYHPPKWCRQTLYNTINHVCWIICYPNFFTTWLEQNVQSLPHIQIDLLHNCYIPYYKNLNCNYNRKHMCYFEYYMFHVIVNKFKIQRFIANPSHNSGCVAQVRPKQANIVSWYHSFQIKLKKSHQLHSLTTFIEKVNMYTYLQLFVLVGTALHKVRKVKRVNTPFTFYECYF